MAWWETLLGSLADSSGSLMGQRINQTAKQITHNRTTDGYGWEMKDKEDLEKSLKEYHEIAPYEFAATLSIPFMLKNPGATAASYFLGEAVNEATNYFSDGEHPTFGHILYQGDNPWLKMGSELANPGYWYGPKAAKGLISKAMNSKGGVRAPSIQGPGLVVINNLSPKNIGRSITGAYNNIFRKVSGKDPITGLPIEGGGFRFDPKAMSFELPAFNSSRYAVVPGYPGFSNGPRVYFSEKFQIPGLKYGSAAGGYEGGKAFTMLGNKKVFDFLRTNPIKMKAKGALGEAQIKLDALKSAVGKLPNEIEVRDVVRNGLNAGKMYIGDNFAIEVQTNGNRTLHFNGREYRYLVPENGSTPVFEGLNNNLSPAASSTPGATFGGFMKNFGKGGLKGATFYAYLPYKLVKWGAPKLGSNATEVIGGIAGSAVPLYFGRELYLRDQMKDNGGLLPIHNEGLQRLKGYVDITDAEKFRDSIANEQKYDPTIPSISESNSRAKFIELANEHINSLYDSLTTPTTTPTPTTTTTTTTPTTTKQQTNPVPPGGAYTVGNIKNPYQ